MPLRRRHDVGRGCPWHIPRRRWVSEVTQQFALLLLGQAVCVAVGLWFYDSQAAASIRTQARCRVWTELAAQGAGRLAAAGARTGQEHLDRAVALKLLADRRPSDADALLVTTSWIPISAAPAGEAPRADDAETPLNWQPAAESTAGGNPMWGRFDGEQGERLAVAWPLGGDAGYLVLHRPTSDAEELRQAFAQDLRPLSLVTLAWTCAVLGVVAYLVIARFHDAAQRQRLQSTTEALKQTQRLVRTRDGVIFALAKLADSRDPETGDHLERITAYAVTLASAARRHAKFAPHITPAFLRLIEHSAMLHDIGKVGVADAVLRKRGPLTEAERREMQRHTVIAGECLLEIAGRVGESTYLQTAHAIAVAHHERWDGTGYPHGLRGEQIPLAARIVAIADVYDALSTRRVHKDSLTHEQAVEQIVQAAGTQFDPDLVRIFQEICGEFARIAARGSESSARPAAPATAPLTRR